MALYLGDAQEVLKTLESNSVDSIVCDPPAGIGFMCKDWDKDKGGRDAWIAWLEDIMREALRVLKPGGHALVWAIPRTSHWTATALENAGFEIRDSVVHIFGSGFPKSLNVGKAIDKAKGVKGEIIGPNPAYREKQLEHNAQWPTRMRPLYKVGCGSEEAKQWEGWGSALKPSHENWILCRKPLAEKSIAENVLKHGTGGLNIDQSRIGYGSSGPDRPLSQVVTTEKAHWGNSTAEDVQKYKPTGRFPSNLLLSHHPDCEEVCVEECAVAELDECSGVLKSGGGDLGHKTQEGGYGGRYKYVEDIRLPSQGGASRFFYCSKASKRDRNAGLEGMPEKEKPTLGKFASPSQGRTASKSGAPQQNHHPTVKSTKLMEYLITLITPPGGVVLDCFAGSGSTLVAAKRLGFEFIGIEKEAEYFEIASRRLENESISRD